MGGVFWGGVWWSTLHNKLEVYKEDNDYIFFFFLFLKWEVKEEIENKKVAFIPTASLREGYTGYVGSARKLFKSWEQS